jgi:hypothetical protein
MVEGRIVSGNGDVYAPRCARDGPLARQDWLRTRFPAGANSPGGVPKESDAVRHSGARRGYLHNGRPGNGKVMLCGKCIEHFRARVYDQRDPD